MASWRVPWGSRFFGVFAKYKCDVSRFRIIIANFAAEMQHRQCRNAALTVQKRIIDNRKKEPTKQYRR